MDSSLCIINISHDCSSFDNDYLDVAELFLLWQNMHNIKFTVLTIFKWLLVCGIKYIYVVQLSLLSIFRTFSSFSSENSTQTITSHFPPTPAHGKYSSTFYKFGYSGNLM